MAGRSAETLGRLHHLHTLELTIVCRAAERVGNRFVVSVLRAASRLGDWPLSVVVGLVLLITSGLRAMALWAATSVAAVLLQSAIKRLCARTRPCDHPYGPPQRAPIPDRGSFPSGHTLHAVMATLVLASLAPILTVPFALIAVLIAISRVALGVHYPSDVAAGAALGVIFGTIQLAVL
jgi:undecaprenyl-diphosphatase